MDFAAIVYTSKNGHTRRYAEMLGRITGKPVAALEHVPVSLPDGSPILYMGWIHASSIRGYKQAAKRFSIPVVCGVGLCDTGTLLAEVRKVSSIPDGVALFTLQGGMDRSTLKGVDRLLIAMLSRGLDAQKARSPQDSRMLELLKSDTDFVREENLRDLLDFIGV